MLPSSVIPRVPLTCSNGTSVSSRIKNPILSLEIWQSFFLTKPHLGHGKLRGCLLGNRCWVRWICRNETPRRWRPSPEKRPGTMHAGKMVAIYKMICVLVFLTWITLNRWMWFHSKCRLQSAARNNRSFSIVPSASGRRSRRLDREYYYRTGEV